MSTESCLVKFCRQPVYAPAGTGSVCKPHFIDFLNWRRKRGLQMFMKYAGMTMAERDTIVEEWKKTVKIEEPAVAGQNKS